MDVPCLLGEDCRRPILPQPPVPESARCKRRLYGLAYVVPQGHGGVPGAPPQPPTAVAKRNERERRRVRMVNLGFNALRNHVPNGAKNKKLSKVETLRSAIEYIRQLQDVVSDDRTENYSPPSPAHFHHPHHHLHHHHHLHNHHMSGLAFSSPPQQNYGQLSGYASNVAAATAATSSGCSTASSPTPSLGSTDSQSPAAPDHFSSSEEEFLAINTWLA